MASKTLTKTDIKKKAIVVTRNISSFLRTYGGAPKLRGDEPQRTVVRVYFTNISSAIDLHYYLSERAGSGRRGEERCWHDTFAGIAIPGRQLNINFRNNQPTLDIT